MTFDDLAQRILEYLRDAVPIAVERDGTQFLVGTEARLQLDLQEHGPHTPVEAVHDDDLVSGVYSILTGVQDEIARVTGLPWPVRAGERLTMPEARIEDGALRFGYYAAGEPMLEFPLIPLR